MYRSRTIFGVGHWRSTKDEAIQDAVGAYDFNSRAHNTQYDFTDYQIEEVKNRFLGKRDLEKMTLSELVVFRSALLLVEPSERSKEMYSEYVTALALLAIEIKTVAFGEELVNEVKASYKF